MRIVVPLAAVLAMICVVIAWSAFLTRSQASGLLEDIQILDESGGPSSVRAFREKHRNQLTYEECKNDLCVLEFQVNNRNLAVVHLVRRTELRVRLRYFHQKLATIGIDYTSAALKQNSPVVHVQEDFCAARKDISCRFFALNPHGCNVTPTWNGMIEFGQQANSAQKIAAWGLNLACLTTLRGCKDISQLSPGIWKATGQGVVSTRMRSTADSIAEASRPLCR